MALQDGDIVDFDYELWIEGQDRLYDTTLREAAEKAGQLQTDAFYAPMTYVLGSGRIIPGLELAIKGAMVGKTIEVAIPADHAYGPRDPKQIETMPMAEFKKNDVEPQVGLPITFKNRRGVVTTVGGGRVRVDFNHPLAGKALRYKFTVRHVAKDDAEKVAAILRMHLPSPKAWKVEMGKVDGRATATVTVPDDVVTRRDWMVAKLRALMDVRRFSPVDRVRFLESYDLNPAEATAPAAPTVERAA